MSHPVAHAVWPRRSAISLSPRCKAPRSLATFAGRVRRTAPPLRVMVGVGIQNSFQRCEKTRLTTGSVTIQKEFHSPALLVRFPEAAVYTCQADHLERRPAA